MPDKKQNQITLQRKNNLYKNNLRDRNYRKNTVLQDQRRWFLLPVVCVVAVLPLIMYIKKYTTDLNQYPWFAEGGEYTDLFLYYKQSFLILLTLIMLIFIGKRAVQDKTNLQFPPIFIPLVVFAILSFLSSVISKYRYYVSA